jgi:hypothetical protein
VWSSLLLSPPLNLLFGSFSIFFINFLWCFFGAVFDLISSAVFSNMLNFRTWSRHGLKAQLSYQKPSLLASLGELIENLCAEVFEMMFLANLWVI